MIFWLFHTSSKISTSIGVWSEILPICSSWLIRMSSLSIPLVSMMSMLVFFYFAPTPFLVHLSISCTSHPSLSNSFFHFLNFVPEMSLFTSTYPMIGISYYYLSLFTDVFISVHLFFPSPFSAWIPASTHLLPYSLVIMLAICLWSLNIYLVGFHPYFLLIIMAVPLPLC